MKYGLIGEKLGHSYSKIIHKALSDYEYNLIPLSKEQVHIFMKDKDFAGINVTIPYKQTVIPYLDEVDPLAEQLGAVNTIINRGGKLKGYNTDFYGFVYTLQVHRIDVNGMKCLVLGTGGTSQTVQAVLKDQNAGEIIVVSRTTGKGNNMVTYDEALKHHTDAQIIINTTPVGMYPSITESPLNLEGFRNLNAVVDVIFNPTPTLLIIQAQQMGINGVNGLEMLVAQAKQAAEYFLNLKIDDSKIDEIYQNLLKQLP